jgi:hypothetical protein
MLCLFLIHDISPGLTLIVQARLSDGSWMMAIVPTRG